MLVKNIYTFLASFSSIKRVVRAKVSWWCKGFLSIGWCFQRCVEMGRIE